VGVQTHQVPFLPTDVSLGWFARCTVRCVTDQQQASSSRQWKRWQTGTLIAALLTAAAYVAQVEVGRTLPLWAHALITGFGACCTAVAIYLPVREQRRNRLLAHTAEILAGQAAGEMRTKLQDFLSLIASLLATIVRDQQNEQKCRNEKGRLKQLVVSLLAENIGPSRARSAFYAYVSGSRRALRFDDVWHGRDHPPITLFDNQSARGSFVLGKVIDERDSLFITNMEIAIIPDWENDRDYNTLIYVPVTAGEEIFGMLTIDAPSAGDLTEQDRVMTVLVGQLLAAGLGV